MYGRDAFVRIYDHELLEVEQVREGYHRSSAGAAFPLQQFRTPCQKQCLQWRAAEA